MADIEEKVVSTSMSRRDWLVVGLKVGFLILGFNFYGYTGVGIAVYFLIGISLVNRLPQELSVLQRTGVVSLWPALIMVEQVVNDSEVSE